jgi:hypothetical protein
VVVAELDVQADHLFTLDVELEKLRLLLERMIWADRNYGFLGHNEKMVNG